jgi:hypothetical protein
MKTVAPKDSLKLPLPADSTQVIVNADAEFELPNPIQNDILLRMIRVETLDVQNSRHPIHIIADAVPWDTANIEQLEVLVFLRFRSNLAIPPFRLSQTQLTETASIVVPIAQALLSLDAIVTVEMQLSEGLPKRTVSVDHDFSRSPMLFLTTENLGVT